MLLHKQVLTLLQGMKRFHARVAVVQALKEAGLFVDTKDNPMQIPICR
jgi:valyl-tRNA synthetase